jgi:hypothetical protein
MSSDLASFVTQNMTMVSGMTEDQMEMIDTYVDHHAGGLYVLWRDLGEENLSVKAHDSWGGDDEIVVLFYDADVPVRERVIYFAASEGEEAFDKFLTATSADLVEEVEPEQVALYVEEKSVPVATIGLWTKGIVETLRGPHPWIPGADFIANPGLAEHLAKATEQFFAEKD